MPDDAISRTHANLIRQLIVEEIRRAIIDLKHKEIPLPHSEVLRIVATYGGSHILISEVADLVRRAAAEAGVAHDIQWQRT
jgi:hypothetical protein